MTKVESVWYVTWTRMCNHMAIGMFHSKCSNAVKLSLDHVIARTTLIFGVALSREPIAI